MLYIYTDETNNIELNSKSIYASRVMVLNATEVLENYKNLLEVTNQQKELMELIDGAKYLSDNKVLTEFGETDLTKLSTTCLTLLVASSHLWGHQTNELLDIGGLHGSGLEQLIKMAQSQDIHVYTNDSNSNFNGVTAYVNGELLEGRLIEFRINLESRGKYKDRR